MGFFPRNYGLRKNEESFFFHGREDDRKAREGGWVYREGTFLETEYMVQGKN